MRGQEALASLSSFTGSRLSVRARTLGCRLGITVAVFVPCVVRVNGGDARSILVTIVICDHANVRRSGVRVQIVIEICICLNRAITCRIAVIRSCICSAGSAKTKNSKYEQRSKSSLHFCSLRFMEAFSSDRHLHPDSFSILVQSKQHHHPSEASPPS